MSSFPIELLNSSLTGSSIRVESRVFPPFTLDLTPDATTGQTSLLGRILQPQVTLLKSGEEVVTFAPYGVLGAQVWPLALAVIGLVLFFWLA